MFKKADTNGDGTINGGNEDMKWEEALNKANHIQPRDSMLVHKDEFVAGCKMGDFDQFLK